MKADEVSMQGGGYYNENCSLQELAIDKSLELLSPIQGQGSSTVLADYGCSEGKNSIRLLSKYLARVPSISSATLVFNDTPFNNFSSLAATIDANLDQLSLDGKLAINSLLAPRSYFQQILPDGFVDAGFNFTALHWLQHMPDASSNASTLSAAAHKDLVAFLSARYKEIRPKGTLTLCIPIHDDIGIAPILQCLETTVRNLYSTYQADPSVLAQTPLYFRTMDEILAAFDAAEGKWHVKKRTVIPILHPSWSPVISESGSSAIKSSACDRYADAVTGMAIAASSQVLIEDLKSQAEQKDRLVDSAFPDKATFLDDLFRHCKEEFLRTHCQDKVGFTYALLELERV
ncbi:hypothetical protein FSARC_2701 [Fusarium sarcochroum]|uniref:Methyltransferase n=1 Tax=Fusarium sarcochroum TaxID=1208366 RepID=A0A8H4U5G3_9HYPO|nr:hypothetical protein FSARC_2701 [Fusarium sarcochroum]